jgi:hypothetical protein
MSAPIEREHPAPPVGEEVHLPGPTIIPMLSALGITLTVIGITLGLPFVVVGLILFVLTTIRWIRDTRRDIDELPPEHTTHH